MTAIAENWIPAGFQSASRVAANPAADSGNSNSGQTSSSSTISANDFLTLLVTEMKNQDPTSTTDPNEYINQLVSVNSLQQLIQINETLNAAVDPGSGSTSKEGTGSETAAPAGRLQDSPTPQPANSGVVTRFVPHAAGNLSIPASTPSAARIAQALSGNQHGI